MRTWMWFALTMIVLFAASAAEAQTFNSGSTGADGAFSPTSNITLALPANGIFNFTTINVPSGVTVKFTRNAGNTPATLLATGDVTISGTIDVSSANGGISIRNVTAIAPNGGAGGPGGFDGGSGAIGAPSSTGGTGLGPGGGIGGGTAGGMTNGVGAGFATVGIDPYGRTGVGGPAYGNPSLLPIVGGSGGGGASGDW